MPRIADQLCVGGALERAERLGLTPLFEEVKQNIVGCRVIRHGGDSNGWSAVRKAIRERFEAAKDCGWVKEKTGGVDWKKCLVGGAIKVCLGVKLQSSGKKDFLLVSILQIRRAVTNGCIDVGIVVAKSHGRLWNPEDRVAWVTDARRKVKDVKAEDLPVIILGVTDGGRRDVVGEKGEKRGRRRLADTPANYRERRAGPLAACSFLA